MIALDYDDRSLRRDMAAQLPEGELLLPFERDRRDGEPDEPVDLVAEGYVRRPRSLAS